MKRSGPIQRKSRMRKKAPRRVASLTADDRRWRTWVHARPCVGYTIIGHVCSGHIEQSHERDMTGFGLKAPERRSVPMCSQLHRAWETHAAPFARWTKEARKVWLDALIEAENAAFERMDAVPW